MAGTQGVQSGPLCIEVQACTLFRAVCRGLEVSSSVHPQDSSPRSFQQVSPRLPASWATAQLLLSPWLCLL